MRNRRLTVPVLASVLSVIAVLVTAGAVFACDWRQLHIVAGDCSIQGGAATRTWTVQNAEAGYTSEWSTDAGFSAANTTSFTGIAVVTVTTPATVDDLYLRFANDHSVKISKHWDGGKCPTTIATALWETKGHIGDSVFDRATLGPAVFTGTGTVTYTVYTDSTCQTKFADAGVKTITGTGVPQSNSVLFNSAGTWYWQAVYSGDTWHMGATSACIDEALVIYPNDTTIQTTLVENNSGQIPDSVYDTATLVGHVAQNFVAVVPPAITGTVTYTVYSDISCRTVFTQAGTKTISGGLVPKSESVEFNSAGTWYWQAVYSGDGNYNPATSSCTEEVLTIGQNSETGIATVPVDENPIENAQTPPDKVHDTATLTGVTANAGGTVTYSLYSCTDQSCTTPALLQGGGTKPVTNGVVTKSDTITLSEPGYYCWLAVYSGDDNNKGATSRCQDEIIVVAEEHQEGETSTPFHTPPPTSSGNGSSSTTMPLMALLICFVFGGLGLTAVEAQRRTIRR